MAGNKEGSRDGKDFDFTISHLDIIDLMNKIPFIELPIVPDDQLMEIFIQKPDGKEISLLTFKAGNRLVFRYNKPVDAPDEEKPLVVCEGSCP